MAGRGGATSRVLTGSQALVGAMMDSHTRAAVVCPAYPVPGTYELLQTFSATDQPFDVHIPAGERSAIRAAFRAATEGNLTALLCGRCEENTVLETFVQLRDMGIGGGMVMVVVDDNESGGSGNGNGGQHRDDAARTAVLEPESAGDIYRFYRSAAMTAAADQTLVILRLSSRICHARVTVARQVLHQAMICPDCRHKPAADMIGKVFSANGAAVAAMGCHTLECQPGQSDPHGKKGHGGPGPFSSCCLLPQWDDDELICGLHRHSGSSFSLFFCLKPYYGYGLWLTHSHITGACQVRTI